MPVITSDAIQSLAEIRAGEGAVVSCYLDVDGRRFINPRDYERTLDTLLRRARSSGTAGGADKDLARIESYVKAGFDRHGVRGLAMFSCAAVGLFEVLPLPVPVRSDLTVNPTASIGQLELLLQHSERLGLLLVDKQSIRICTYNFGELVDETAVVDELPRDYDRIGEQDRGGVDHHVEELVHQHLRHAAAVAWEVHQRVGLDRIVIGASDAMASEVLGDLHPYLKERYAGRVDLGTDASDAAVRDAAIAVEMRIEREREAADVQALRDAVASGGKGTAGLDNVLDALADHRVERLLVSSGFKAEGWRCDSCGRLASVGRSCSSCTADLRQVDDIVAEAVEEALAQSCRVEMCADNADLDVLGRIGALLRY